MTLHAPPTRQDTRVRERRTGPLGLAFRLPPVTNPNTLPETSATLAQWVVHVPSSHPVWPHYLLSLAHLREIPGTPALDTLGVHPEASHEFMLHALSPVYAPWDEATALSVICLGLRIRRPRYEPFLLNPPNVGLHLLTLTDAQAEALVEPAVDAILTGKLPADVQQVNGTSEGHARWHEAIWAAANVLREGGTLDGRLPL